MKILIINEFGEKKVKECDQVPRIGDKVDVFCRPRPVVSSVLWWPADGALSNFDVVITVGG